MPELILSKAGTSGLAGLIWGRMAASLQISMPQFYPLLAHRGSLFTECSTIA
jgi:hypothetical protein